MAISYNKLWKLLIDRNMKKSDLREKAQISSSSIAKLGRNENVNTDILVKICKALNCKLEDIAEYISEYFELDKVNNDEYWCFSYKESKY